MTARKHTAQGEYPIRLFVYGTLKRGGWNHDRFCRNAVDIQPAMVWGRLWQLPAGFPAMEVPESLVLAHGTINPYIDAQTQHYFYSSELTWEKPDGDWDLVNGEVMTFLDPERDLPPIDLLEGFRPPEKGLYERVFVCALHEAGFFLAWLYRVQVQSTGTRISHGNWNW